MDQVGECHYWEQLRQNNGNHYDENFLQQRFIFTDDSEDVLGIEQREDDVDDEDQGSRADHRDTERVLKRVTGWVASGEIIQNVVSNHDENYIFQSLQ